MAIKRHKPEEIVTKLRQVEVLVGQGVARIDAIREVQITEQTFYREPVGFADGGHADGRITPAATACFPIRRFIPPRK